jgi:2'-hydroxyisoflavone reductase
MRLLILGGTQFLGRALAAAAYARGHAVTCAARGVTGAVADGVRLIRVDRDAPDGLAPLAVEPFDAVIDVSRHPGQVRRAVAALKERAAHWTFVSTVSVYADNATPGQHADTAPLRAPTAPEIEHSTTEIYGSAKVACEQAVGSNALICRAGLIAGPEDPTGRFTYWPVRLARGGAVLVPAAPDEAVQLIDVRDVARWIVQASERSLTGCFDVIAPPVRRGDFLAQCAAAVDADCSFVWADRAFLEANDVKRWAGPRSLPLWVPLPEFAGYLTRDTSPALAEGLTLRPLAETARDTLAWVRSANGPVSGLTVEEERAVIASWHQKA